MIELIIGTTIGAFISWAISHIYYKKSATEIPPWANTFIEKLPERPITPEVLLRLYQKSIDDGDIIPHPLTGRISCPECATLSTDFLEKVFGDDRNTVVITTCPNCGWNESADF